MRTILFIFLFITLLAYGKQKPNVILIVSDDHGYADFSYKQNYDYIKTPHLDQMVEEGVNFTNAYVTAPICSPSRNAMMTGQYQARHGVYFYGGPGFSTDTKTIAQGFKNEGYSTAYFGKLHYGKNDKPDGYGHPINHGFDESIVAGVGGRVHYLFHNEKAVEKHSATAAPWFKDGKTYEKDGFTTEVISEWAQEYIASHKEEPFFLQIAFNAVHNFNYQLPEEYLKEWNLPYYADYEELDTDETYSCWYNRSILPDLPNGRAYYAAQLFYLDKEIGNIRSQLQDLGLDENTIVVYISDNGGSNCNGGENAPLRSTKYSLYEGGVRVPLIMCWGDKYQNVESDMMVSAMDLMPTLLTAAKASKSTYEDCDGMNIMPYISRPEKMQRNELVWDVGFAWAVRQGDWKLKVVTDQKKANKISKFQHTDLGEGIELYNLKEDISETTNLAEQYPKIVDQLTEVHTEWLENVSVH